MNENDVQDSERLKEKQRAGRKSKQVANRSISLTNKEIEILKRLSPTGNPNKEAARIIRAQIIARLNNHVTD